MYKREAGAVIGGGNILVTLAFIVVGNLFLVACSSTANDPIYVGDILVEDPLEENNRRIFAFNTAIDKAIIHPVVKGYRAIVPKPARNGLRNFLRNIKSPITFANQLLQGDLPGASDVIVRSSVNTLLGAGGVFDLAGYEGIEYEPEDFGQTLALWGVGHGPYLVVPFLGPSSIRDYAGYATDSIADPLRWYLHNIDEEWVYYTKSGLDYLDLRESFMDVLEDLESSSIDYYASVRSIYYQRRAALVRDEREDQQNAPEFPDYNDF